jgi:GT2 family glycosyltransferase
VSIPDVADWPPDEVRAAVLNSVQLCADPFAQEAAVDYWDMSRAAHQAVVAALLDGAPATLTAAVAAVSAAPADPARLAELDRVLSGELAGRPGLGAQALQADALGRLSVHLGHDHRADVPAVTAAQLVAWSGSRRPPAPSGARPAVAVVVPFRDRTPTGSRLRNLLACLAALRDQSADPSGYRVVVVEADSEARCGDVIRAAADDYLYLPAPGHFNKAWAVNAGIVQRSAGAALICVLDADVLVDRDFVARNQARFRARGAQAHLPYRDALCLDEPSSSRAVAARVLEGAPEASPDQLRGVFLRRPPGHCVWVRRGLFDRVGGFDERFEGWGGEDLDFVFRLDVVGAVDRYSDPLLHLFHDRPQTQENGRRFYAGRRLLSWRPTGPIGQLGGPAASSDDDLAGLIERSDQVPVG